ncbi:tetratricopeptide repeat protein [Chamaesiphon minutus]|uniref:Tetratricopeptide repeat protein n=1 Tax=Chamaesiphon minutus (strain ATCC 27169 / PCC 6605) TaxID=1173020 RepID=K9UQJ9_CHAP6|nr:tetratricopeptide repeat protein [Chamaesiphon minutus]AFY96958.1 hypothetical protein Cha6605_6123 [Chamaesiphon minutus PCC 6605]
MNSLLQQAFTAFDNGQLPKAEGLYLLALRQHAEAKDEKYKNAANGLAFTYSLQNHFDRAREIYSNLYEIVCAENDLKWQAITLHQLGMVERLAENFKEAQQIFRHEYDFRVSNLPGDLTGFCANQYEQGYLYLKLACLSKAEQAMSKALEMAQQAGDRMCIGCSYRGLGEVYLALGNLSRAKEEFLFSMKAFEQAGDKIAVLEVQKLVEALTGTAQR